MGMHAVFRDWMYARKARRRWQIQEFLIWRGGGSKFWFRRDCWTFLWPAEKAATSTCFSTCERRSPLVRGILLCEQRRTDHRRVHKQARTRTGFQRFTEIGQIFHNKYIFNKKTFQVEIWKMDWTNTLSEENWTGQYPIWMTQKLRKGDLRELKNFLGEHAPGPPWTLRRLFRKSVSICPRSAPAKNDYNLEYPWNLV